MRPDSGDRMNQRRLSALFTAVLLPTLLLARAAPGDVPPAGPHARQVAEQTAALKSSSPRVRGGAAEALGYLRAWAAADALADALADSSPVVRREAAMSLGWCGGRSAVKPLLAALDDKDWTVRQAAWVALTNLTGMEFPFDALAKPPARQAQARKWRDWWAKVPDDHPPKDVMALLGVAARRTGNLALGCKVSLSSVYRGPAAVLTDGALQPGFWQTKNVPFPQHCTVDLGKEKKFACVVVHQYGSGFCMTDFALSTSADGRTFKQVLRRKATTDPRLVVTFPPLTARYVRVTSYRSQRSIYPTTFREIEVWAKTPSKPAAVARAPLLRTERGLRALGALGGAGASEAVAERLGPLRAGRGSFADKALIQAGIRALGRLRGPKALPVLTAFLDSPQWARYAADALGDLGGPEAEAALLAAYPKYARNLGGRNPKQLPRDDRPGLDPRDRMYETPYAIASALARLPLTDQKNLATLREIAPLLAANMPTDYDGAMLYEPEAWMLVTAHLLERAGVRQSACDAAFAAFGRPRKNVPKVFADLAGKRAADVPYAAIWLPALCRKKTDTPDLIALLEHKNGWVRINAAKALMFMGDRRAIGPITKLLAASKPESAYGYFGGFVFNKKLQGHDEYNDPAPRWREAFIRALGGLGAPLPSPYLTDVRSSLGIQYASALTLAELGTPEALAELKRAEATHPYHSIRLVAREALWRRGVFTNRPAAAAKLPLPAETALPAAQKLEAVVFIKGNNNMPNDFQIDPWRQTYSTTDSGPTYRPGRNLYLLRPARPDGKVTPLTNFADGYVADCEVSWDGRRIVFAHRGGSKDPWWHVWEIGADGKGLRQITRGAYHDVQPAYLPDGRIVFSSSRIGMRDEYHGYLATGLTVMNPDGSDIHCIGFNLGRDNEPAVLNDGRIVFSRLELFYSRMKTEITVQAANPDGTRNVTLYGPERRALWRSVTRKSREGWWGEVAPRHRVLRMTQPQPFGLQQVICATTGGLTVVGPGRYRERIIPRDRNMATTTPIPLPDGRVLCAATVREKNPAKIDLGLYLMDAKTGKLTLLYNDPKTADFEPRPLHPRRRPPVLAEDPASRSGAFTGRLFCRSVQITQNDPVRQRGKYVRVVEGQPLPTRHHTHTSAPPAWKNHTGTFARILGTVPLASDGSFYIEVPADRLIHVQVLDSDRRVVGNQQIWMYVRPGETRSCVGCHERPDTTTMPPVRSRTLTMPPVQCLPTGGEFSYRAKFWNKGTLTDEGEERTRTVRAVNLIGRQ